MGSSSRPSGGLGGGKLGGVGVLRVRNSSWGGGVGVGGGQRIASGGGDEGGVGGGGGGGPETTHLGGGGGKEGGGGGGGGSSLADPCFVSESLEGAGFLCLGFGIGSPGHVGVLVWGATSSFRP